MKIQTPTVKQYQEAIANRLSSRQIEILQAIYYRPNSAATAKELAEDMGYKSYHGANRQVGAIGKAIYQHTGVEPPVYESDNEKFAYFYLVGNYNGPGWKLWSPLKTALQHLGLIGENQPNTGYTNRLPTEVLPFEENKLYEEGKVTEVFVNRYERNREARTACIKHYGAFCQACGFDFGAFYGCEAQGFIHVHHILPLAEIGKSYKIDPIKDLLPLCANCHSVVHLNKSMLTIDQLKKLIKK